MASQLKIFISSKMIELKEEREFLYEFLPQLSTDEFHIKAWLFEKDTCADKTSDRQNILQELKDADLYLGIFWNEYSEHTIDEFNKASKWFVPRQIYVKNITKVESRDERLSEFLTEIQDVKSGLTENYFNNLEDLKQKISQSIQGWLQTRLHPTARTAELIEFADDVPSRPDKLCGRDTLMSTIRDSLETRRCVLLQGMGGAGKTALATTIASQWIKDQKGQVLWQEIGSERKEIIFEVFAACFNARSEMSGKPEYEQKKLLRNLIRRSPVTLVVLDNSWDEQTLNLVIEAMPEEVKVLVTSRQSFTIKSRCILEVGQLLPEEALETLEHYAGTVYPDKKDAADLCETLGYLPISLEIAGTLLYRTPMSPTKLCEQLETTPHALSDKADDPTVITFDKLLTVSLNSLRSPTRQALMAIGGLFGKQVTPELLGLHLGFEADSHLDTLFKHNLIRRIDKSANEIEYYQLHDLVYSYAQSGKYDQRQQGLNACQIYLQQHNEPQVQHFAALTPVISNLTGAIEWAMNNHQRQIALTLVDNLILEGSMVMDYQCFFAESISLLESALRVEQSQEKQAIYLYKLGKLCWVPGQYTEAINYLYHGLQIIHADHTLRPKLLNELGWVYVFSGKDAQKGLEYMQEALALAVRGGDLKSQSEALSSLNFYYYMHNDPKKAVKYGRQALHLIQQVKDARIEGEIAFRLANTLTSIDDYDGAIEYYNRCLAIADQTGDRAIEGNALLGLADIYMYQADYKMALEVSLESLEISQLAHDYAGECEILWTLGKVYTAQERYDEGEASLQQAIHIAQVFLENEFYTCRLYGVLGELFWKKQQMRQALDAYKKSISMEDGWDEGEFDQANLAEFRGRIAYLEGDLPQALLGMEKASQLWAEGGDQFYQAMTLTWAGDIAAELRELNKVANYYNRAISLFQKMKLWRREAEARQHFETLLSR